MEVNRELEEFEIVNKPINIDEIIIYRDIDDMGREFVTEQVLTRFHFPIPNYSLHLEDGTEIFEVTEDQSLFIIRRSHNEFAPYLVRYQNFDFKNELEDEKQKSNVVQERETIKIYRDIINSGRSFVTGDIIDRFHLQDSCQGIIVIDEEFLFEISDEDVVNIVNNSDNPIAPYDVVFIGIEIEDEIPLEEIRKPEKIKQLAEEEEIYKAKELNVITAVRKPRPRMEGESDESYISYVEGFYDGLYDLSEIEETPIVRR